MPKSPGSLPLICLDDTGDSLPAKELEQMHSELASARLAVEIAEGHIASVIANIEFYAGENAEHPPLVRLRALRKNLSDSYCWMSAFLSDLDRGLPKLRSGEVSDE